MTVRAPRSGAAPMPGFNGIRFRMSSQGCGAPGSAALAHHSNNHYCLFVVPALAGVDVRTG